MIYIYRIFSVSEVIISFFSFHISSTSCLPKRVKWQNDSEQTDMKSETYSGIKSGSVAGVIVTLALWIWATVDSNAGARGELVAGAQRRV